MSLCRWSSQNWMCDLYVYHHYLGFVSVNVAANRIVGDIPQEPLLSDPDWVVKHRAVMAFLKDAKRESIGLKYAGETHDFPDPKEAANFLKELRELGYKFPDDVIEDLNNDAT